MRSLSLRLGFVAAKYYLKSVVASVSGNLRATCFAILSMAGRRSQHFVDWVRRTTARIRLPWRSKPRDLRREAKEQTTEDYWRRRMDARSRRLRLNALWHRFESLLAGARQNVGIAFDIVLSMVRALALGALSIVAVPILEHFLARQIAPILLPLGDSMPLLGAFASLAAQVFAPILVPSGDSTPLLGAFPSLAAQVSASLLGFYLASVGIVLGTSYHNVSADVRGLVLGNARATLYLRSVGMAIGAGLTLVLMGSLGVSYGYLTAIGYCLLVIFSAWAFGQLAFGAFNLFNPIVLGQEPIRVLYHAINKLGSKRLTGQETVLRAESQEANRALSILAELIDVTSGRASIDRSGLAQMVETLLGLVQIYTQKKHLLAPESAWFISEVVYPRWVETHHSEVSRALKTATPLLTRTEPAADWLERRSAELASAALETCVVANDRSSTLRITRGVAETVHAMASCYRLDDAISFSGVVRDRCWAIRNENAAAVAAAAEPPLFLTNLLLGWRRAIVLVPDEVGEVVAATKWDRKSTTFVRIRGTTRVRTVAQRLLQEVRAEQEIEGRRVTPDWYLRLALADACILSLREFAKQLPELLSDFIGRGLKRSTPAARVMTGSQALQAVSKAQLVIDDIPKALEGLENLRLRNDPQPAQELEDLAEQVKSQLSPILEGMAEAMIRIQPGNSSSEPDLFGEALYKLVHHAELAIESGDVALVTGVFPNILRATLTMQSHVISTYQPPTYQYNAALVDPMIDILELSGLALIYEVLREDRSANPIRQAWIDHLQSQEQPKDAAKRILFMLDLVDGGFSFGVSQRDIARTEWETRLYKRVVEAGYAAPEYDPLAGRRTWTAPPLIKMLGVSRLIPRISLPPRAIFAAEVIGPMSGESEEVLRARDGLRRYYEERDRHGTTGITDKGDYADRGRGVGGEDSLQ